MKRSHAIGQSRLARFPASWLAAGLMAVALAASAPASAASADDLSSETRACLDCHDKPVLNKALDNGETLSLAISAPAYAAPLQSANGTTATNVGSEVLVHGFVDAAKLPFPIDAAGATG